MAEKVVILGTGSFAECVHFYLTHDSPHEVVAFTVSRDVVPETTEFKHLPVVAFEEIQKRFPPTANSMYVAVGYRDLNRVRARLCGEARAKGYNLITYISSRATTWPGLEIGDNCFVFEDNTIQPFTRIGDDVVLWSGNHVGHHVTISDHCFITSHVVISGHVKVGSYSFIGVNATLRDGIRIGEANVIGSGALVMKSTEDREVYAPQRTKPRDQTSDEIRM